MPLPDFLIIGAQKAGTTWLRRQLRQHPDVFMPSHEIHFFDKRYNYEKGSDWYRQFFTEASSEKAVGEKTPDYYWTGTAGAEDHLPDAHRKIYDLLPDVRLLLVLRNPVDRAISAVNHIVRSGRVSPRHSADQLLVGEMRHLVEPHGVIDYGRYMKHIEAYLELFQRKQLQILIFEEDIVRHPEEGLAKATRFLGIDPTFSFPEVRKKVNAPSVSLMGLYARYYLPWIRPLVDAADAVIGSREVKLRPRDETVEKLYRTYEADNERLFEFLGREIEPWKPGH